MQQLAAGVNRRTDLSYLCCPRIFFAPGCVVVKALGHVGSDRIVCWAMADQQGRKTVRYGEQ